jgi:hypothetical protein
MHLVCAAISEDFQPAKSTARGDLLNILFNFCWKQGFYTFCHCICFFVIFINFSLSVSNMLLIFKSV